MLGWRKEKQGHANRPERYHKENRPEPKVRALYGKGQLFLNSILLMCQLRPGFQSPPSSGIYLTLVAEPRKECEHGPPSGHRGSAPSFPDLGPQPALRCMDYFPNGTRPPLDADVNLEALAGDLRCDCYSGADLSALVREASVCALRQEMARQKSGNEKGELKVSQRHFEEAFKKVKSSISKKDQVMYEALQRSLSR